MACPLRLGADLNAKNDKGQSLLYLATQNNSQQGLQFLLDTKADPNLIDKKLDDMLLHYAIQENYLEAALLLQCYRARCGQALGDGTTAFHLMAEKVTIEIAEAMWPKEKSL